MKNRVVVAMIACSLIVFPQVKADSVLYGSIRTELARVKKIENIIRAEGKYKTGSKRVFNVQDILSRIGIKGGETLGNGIKVIYHLEYTLNSAEGLNLGQGFYNRLTYIGLSSDTWGSVRIGRLYTPFYQMLVDNSLTWNFRSVYDPAANRTTEAMFFGAFDGKKVLYNASKNKIIGYNKNILGMSRLGNQIIYESPNFNGFSFSGGIVIDDDEKGHLVPKKEIDLWTINVRYQHSNGFYIRTGYIQGYTIGKNDNDPTEMNSLWTGRRKTDVLGLHLGYSSDAFSIYGLYSNAKFKIKRANNRLGFGHKRDKAIGWDVGGRYSFGTNYYSSIYAIYGESKFKQDESIFGPDMDTLIYRYDWYKNHPKEILWAMGFEQKLSQRTSLWIEYSNVKTSGSLTQSNADNSSVSHRAKYDVKTDKFSLGVRHDF